MINKSADPGKIRKSMMRFFSLICLMVFFVMSMGVETYAQKANFSGTWVFNESKSNLGQQGQGGGFRFGGGQLTVKQEGNNLTIDRVRQNQNGEPVTTTEKYTLDGKESVNTTQRGSSKSIVTWSADGKSLNIVTNSSFERDGQTNQMKSTSVWKLTDSKTLSIESVTPSRDGGERKTTRVYDKK